MTLSFTPISVFSLVTAGTSVSWEPKVYGAVSESQADVVEVMLRVASSQTEGLEMSMGLYQFTQGRASFSFVFPIQIKSLYTVYNVHEWADYTTGAVAHLVRPFVWMYFIRKAAESETATRVWRGGSKVASYDNTANLINTFSWAVFSRTMHRCWHAHAVMLWSQSVTQVRNVQRVLCWNCAANCLDDTSLFSTDWKRFLYSVYICIFFLALAL